MNKACIYADINNIYHRIKKLDWKLLKEWLESQYEIERLVAYNSIDHSNQAQIKYNTYLSVNGWKVEDPNCNAMSNVDPIIITHMVNDASNLKHNTIVLIGCDGGYWYPMSELSKKGFKLHTIGCKDNISYDLLRISDKITYLENIDGVVK